MGAFDTSDLRRFAASVDAGSAALAPAVHAVLVKGALNIKGAMRADAEASTHFKGIARSIDFDTTEARNALEAEIGPRHGAGEAGNLANIAYFGNSKGGGGTVRDPQEALDAESSRFTNALGDVIGGVL